MEYDVSFQEPICIALEGVKSPYWQCVWCEEIRTSFAEMTSRQAGQVRSGSIRCSETRCAILVSASQPLERRVAIATQ